MKRTALLSALVFLAFNGCGTLDSGVGLLQTWPEPSPAEASGLAYLPDYDLILTHDDDSVTRLFAWSPASDRAFVIDLSGVPNRDWEDITLIPRDEAPPVVVVGEIGDNAARYPVVSLHFFELVGLDNREAFPAAVYLGSQPFQYPEGPRDAESLMYDPVDRSLLVLTKRDAPPGLYEVPYPKHLRFPESPETALARFLGPVPSIPQPDAAYLLANPGRGRWSAQPTGADISPDGGTLAVITYNDLHLFRRSPGSSWAETLASSPESIDVKQLQQTEAITFAGDSESLFITTEGDNPEILTVRLGSPL